MQLKNALLSWVTKLKKHGEHAIFQAIMAIFATASTGHHNFRREKTAAIDNQTFHAPLNLAWCWQLRQQPCMRLRALRAGQDRFN